jgi:hypothetical protein
MARTKDDRRIVQGAQLPMPARDADGNVKTDKDKNPLPARTFDVFTAGMEDELEAHATPEQIAHLKKKGAIEGDGWKPASGDPKAVAAVREAKEADAREAEEKAAAESEKATKAATHAGHHAATHDAGHKAADKKS